MEGERMEGETKIGVGMQKGELPPHAKGDRRPWFQ